MKTIVVDDERILLRSFERISNGIEEAEVIGYFQYPTDALEFARKNNVELAVLDIAMPDMSGIELAVKLREIKPDMLIVFVTAFDDYIQESNQMGIDYYILKPYKKEVLEMMFERMALLVQRQKKSIYIRMFGRVMVFKDGQYVKLSGKAKEIFAMIVAKRGKEISNEEIYSTIWEDREYDNIKMKVYYNALKRLRSCLEREGLSDLIISTTRGQMANTDMFDCDYYNYIEGRKDDRDKFEGELLSEYSWGEYYLANLIMDYYRK